MTDAVPWTYSRPARCPYAVRTITATVRCALYRTHRHASVNPCLSQPAWTTMTKRRDHNLFVGSSLYEVELALDILYY